MVNIVRRDFDLLLGQKHLRELLPNLACKFAGHAGRVPVSRCRHRGYEHRGQRLVQHAGRDNATRSPLLYFRASRGIEVGEPKPRFLICFPNPFVSVSKTRLPASRPRSFTSNI